MQKTLVLLKPDCVQRQFCGEILTRFERAGLKLVGMKMVHIDENFSQRGILDYKDLRDYY